MAAWQFKANGKLYIAVKNTAGRWVVLNWDRTAIPGNYKTRAEAMRSIVKA